MRHRRLGIDPSAIGHYVKILSEFASYDGKMTYTLDELKERGYLDQVKNLEYSDYLESFNLVRTSEQKEPRYRMTPKGLRRFKRIQKILSK